MKTQEEIEREFKQCATCKIYKRFTEFNKSKQKKDGYLYSCRECSNEMARSRDANLREDPEWYAKDLEKNRSYMAAKRSDPSFIEYHDPQLRTNYQKANPEKNRAHALLNYHVKKGNVTKLPCQICGKEKVDGHHEDYSKPKEVIWLCRAHHREIHRKFNTIRQRLGIPEHNREL